MYRLYPCTTAEQLFRELLRAQRENPRDLQSSSGSNLEPGLQLGLRLDLSQSRFAPKPQMLFQNSALGEWLKVRLAQEQGVSIGLSVAHSQEVLEHYLAYFFAETETMDWIHQDIIGLLLFQGIVELLQHRSAATSKSSQNALKGTAESYLPKSLHTVLYSATRDQHLWAFCQTMAQLFMNYDSYRGELKHALQLRSSDVEGVADGRFAENLAENWQKKLWHSVQELQGFYWPGQLIEQVLQEGRQPLKAKEQREPLYIIGSGFLSAQQQGFYNYLAQFVPVYHFWLTPAYFPKDLCELAEQNFFGRAKKNEQKKSDDELKSQELMARLGGLPQLLWLENSLHSAALLSKLVPWQDIAADASEAQEFKSLLHFVQQALRFCASEWEDKTQPQANEAKQAKASLEDGSIQFFACSDTRREVEVLKDQILAALDENPTWQLNDIAILAPDINQYQAMIQSVFLHEADREGEKKTNKVNCNFIDLQIASQSAYLKAFDLLLGFSQSRFVLDECLEFLQSPCCKASQLLEQKPSDFWQRVFRHWKIIWGIDQAQKAEVLSSEAGYSQAEHSQAESSKVANDGAGQRDVPTSKLGTWKGGLSRFVKDYLNLPILGVSPSSEAGLGQNGLEALCTQMLLTHAEAELIAEVLQFVLRLEQRFSDSHSISDWVQQFENLQDEFLICREGNESDKRDHSLINMSLRNFLAIEESLLSGLDEAANDKTESKAERNSKSKSKSKTAGNKLRFPFSVVESLLRQKLEQSHSSRGRYLTQGITCASLQPYRSVPFRMICVLGLNEKDFPRSSSALRFDLCAELSQHLSRQAQEHHIFAEILISAQERLLLSYQNRDMQRGTEKQASTVLHELAFFIADELDLEEQDVWQRLLQVHPIFPFDTAYFQQQDHSDEMGAGGAQPDSVRFFSYNRRAYLQQKALGSQNSQNLRSKVNVAQSQSEGLQLGAQNQPNQAQAIFHFQDLISVVEDAPSFFWQSYSGLKAKSHQRDQEVSVLSDSFAQGEKLVLNGLQRFDIKSWRNSLWREPQLLFALASLAAPAQGDRKQFEEFLELEGLLTSPLLREQQTALYYQGIRDIQSALQQAELPLDFEAMFQKTAWEYPEYPEYHWVLEQGNTVRLLRDSAADASYFLPALQFEDSEFENPEHVPAILEGSVERGYFDGKNLVFWNCAPFQFPHKIYHLLQQSFLREIYAQFPEAFSLGGRAINNFTQIIWDYSDGLQMQRAEFERELAESAEGNIEEASAETNSKASGKKSTAQSAQLPQVPLEDWVWLAQRAAQEPLPLSTKFLTGKKYIQKKDLSPLPGSIPERCQILEAKWRKYIATAPSEHNGRDLPEAYQYVEVSFPRESDALSSPTLLSERFWSILCKLLDTL